MLPEERSRAKWDKLLPKEGRYNDYEYPKVSIILPTFNCSASLSITLDAALSQSYPNFELIVVDSGSNDHTLEIVKALRSEKIHIYSISDENRYAAINAGIAQSRGEYINILFPGDFYLHKNTLLYMMDLSLDAQKPSLLFCGTLLRGGKGEAKVLYRHLTLKLLQDGKQPTSLQACWFKRSLFDEIGKFNTSYEVRGGFDLFCRYEKTAKHQTVSRHRVLLDYDLRRITKRQTMKHFTETFKIIKNHFGVKATLKWFFVQKDLQRLFNEWLARTKMAFLGR